MRNLTKDYTYTAGTRSITVAGEAFTVENIRLIVNETQKKVLCSSMQKDLVSVTNNVITYSGTLPALTAGDVLTIEIDYGVIPIFSTNAEVAEGKEVIADNLTAMGVTASATESLTALGGKILQAGLQVNLSSQFEFKTMAGVYDPAYPYMYALIFQFDTPDDILAQVVDGEVVVSGVGTENMFKYVVCKRSQQNFSAAYGATFKNYLVGVSVYNANISNVNFYGTRLAFVIFNEDYTPTTYTVGNSQFRDCRLGAFILPPVESIDIHVGNDYGFGSSVAGGSTIAHILMRSTQTSLTIGGGSTWQGCSSLTSFTLPPNLTSLTIGRASTWNGCTSLTSFTMPPNLTSLTIGGGSTWAFCNSLTRITLNPNWRLTANFSTASAFTHDGIVLMFGELVDKRADGVNATTVSTNSSSPIVTGVNSQFTKVFVVGDTININAVGNRTIASINSDTQLTLTANAAATGTGLAYNINKTLTLGATNLAKVSAAEIAVATAKGWTIN